MMIAMHIWDYMPTQLLICMGAKYAEEDRKSGTAENTIALLNIN